MKRILFLKVFASYLVLIILPLAVLDFLLTPRIPELLTKGIEEGMLFLSEALIGEPLGLRQIDNELWSIHFGPVPLAVYHAGTRSIKKWDLHHRAKKV